MPRLIVFFAYLTSFAFAQLDECRVSDTNTCDYASLEGPTMIFPGGDTGCLYVDTAIPYAFQVDPGVGEDANNVVLHFQGGGLCVSEDCPAGAIGPPLSSPTPLLDGIFDDREGNPFRDWTIVVVSYCSGDLHLGDRISEDGTLRFNGRNNTKSVLDWFYANLPAPNRLFLTGCSAGSIGAQYWSHSILNALSDTDTVVSVVYDSYVGVAQTDDVVNARFVDLWNYCSDSDFGWTSEQYEACLNYEWTIADMQKMTHASHKDVPFVFVAFKNDPAIRIVHCNLLGKSRCTQREHYTAYRQLLRSYVEEDTENNNVLSALLDGPYHCLLPWPEVYVRLDGQVIQNLAALANRDPASTVVYSYCVTPWWNPWWSWRISDYNCNSVLRNAVFEP